MSEAWLHVVFGTDQAGSALAAQLAGLGLAVRAVSRHRPVTLAGGPTDGPRLPQIPRWPPTRPRAPRWCSSALLPVYAVAGAVAAAAAGVLAAAERTGPLLVVVENLGGSGRAGSKASTPREKEKRS